MQNGVDPSYYPEGTQEMVFYPTNKIRVPVNKENVLKSGIVKPEDADLIVPYIDIDLPTSGITKNQFLMLDILANNNWERPIYFTGGSYNDAEYIWMKPYLQLDGLVYKLVPIETPLSKVNPYLMGRIDSSLMYDIVMQWDWGNAEDPNIYHDPETRKNSISFRSNLARLAESLILEGKNDKARNILDLAMEKMPVDYFGYYSLLVPFVDGYFRLGDQEKARSLYQQLAFKYADRLAYYASLAPADQYGIGEEIITEIERYRTLTETLSANNETDILEAALEQFTKAITPLVFLYGNYDFYTQLYPVIEGYYSAGVPEKAKALADKILQALEGRMQVYSRFSSENQMLLMDRIKSELMDFQEFVLLVQQADTSAYATEVLNKYNASVETLLVEETTATPEED